MTIETNSGQIKLEAIRPEDLEIMQVIGLAVLRSETDGVLHALEDQDVWSREEEQNADNAEEDKVNALIRGLKLVKPDFDPENPVLTIEPDEFTPILDALVDADELGVEGLDHSEFVKVEEIFGKAA